MLKKVLTYTDFDGEERTEEFYFNLTKAELVKMRYSAAGGMERRLQRIVNEKDPHKIIEVIEDFIKASYGVKSDDGKRFVKSEKLFEDFKSTEAYSDLLIQLMTDEGAAAAFVNGIVPPDVAKAAAEESAKREANIELLPSE